MDDGNDPDKRINSTGHRCRMALLNLFLMARDRPFLFFSLAMPFLFILWVFDAIIISIVYHLVLVPLDLKNIIGLVVAIVFLPAIPVFFGIVFLFVDFYFYITFGLLPMKWTSVFRRRKIVNALIAWTDRKPSDEAVPE